MIVSYTTFFIRAKFYVTNTTGKISLAFCLQKTFNRVVVFKVKTFGIDILSSAKYLMAF